MITDELRRKWKSKANAVQWASEHGEIQLNDWETEFLDSITRQMGEGRDLSFKQSSVLYRIFDRI